MAQQTQELALPKQILTLYERVLFFLIALTLVTSGLSALENVGAFGLADGVWRSGWLQNFSTEMFGAALTLVLIGRIIGAEDRKHEMEENEKQLEAMREAVTQAVTEEMWRIQQANAIARLQTAKNEPPDVRQPIINEMIRLSLLKEADLRYVDLRQVYLEDGNLFGADMRYADLREAYLVKANLNDVDLQYADLQEADLGGANIQGVSLQSAIFDEKTTLPDDDPYNKRSFWTPTTDMTRFTDPSHPEFWRSDDPDSPAYRGDAATDEDKD